MRSVDGLTLKKYNDVLGFKLDHFDIIYNMKSTVLYFTCFNFIISSSTGHLIKYLNMCWLKILIVWNN